MEKTLNACIFDSLSAKLSLVTIVLDFNGLVKESVISRLRDDGFTIISAMDPLQMRFDYERFIDEIRRQESLDANLIIVQQNGFQIPPDIYSNARVIELSYDSFFPNLSASILSEMADSDLDGLFEIYQEEKPTEELGRDRTSLFVLRCVYHIHPQEIKTDDDFVSLLLRTHYQGIRIPQVLTDYFARYLERKHRLQNWNCSLLLNDSQVFWSYLQKAWDNAILGLNINLTDGPSQLDFRNPRIAVYIDDAFDSGLLHMTHPLEYGIRPRLIPESLFKLVNNSRTADTIRKERQKSLLEKMNRYPFSEASTLQDVLSFQKLYSEYRFASLGDIDREFVSSSNATFRKWVAKHYDSLCFESSTYPVILPKVVDFLRTRRPLTSNQKIAVVVMDGLSYSQWLSTKAMLNGLRFEEHSCFACLPTLTPVSRQSIFAGAFPRYFANSIDTTSKEAQKWSKSWDSITSQYIKSDGLGSPIDLLGSIDFGTKALGIVLNTIDDLMHSALLGNQSMNSGIEIWMKNGFLQTLLDGLLEKGFSVWVTSDHGNIEAEGVGQIKEGCLAETEGQRVRVYNSKSLADRCVTENEGTCLWISKTLPDDYYIVDCVGDGAFIKKGQTKVVHGGISIDELIVPFVGIERE